MFKEIKELLKTEDTWTQNAYSRNSFNSALALDYGVDDAVKWDLSGACWKLFKSQDTLDDFEYKLQNVGMEYNLTEWNDNHTHKEIIELLDKAIEKYEN